jgi:hypothetical protein
MDCFEQFKTDKHLLNWQLVLNKANSTSLTESDSSGDDFNIMTVDFLLSQMAEMRDVVNYYYKYITNMAGEELSLSNKEGNNKPICTMEELSRWKELDALYVAIEYGYLAYSIKDALRETALIEVESGSVYAPQAIEDLFFILLRVAERSISTGSEHSIMSICNIIVDYLNPDNNMIPANNNELSSIYLFITSRSIYKGCSKNSRINTIIPSRSSEATAGNAPNSISISTSRGTSDSETQPDTPSISLDNISTIFKASGLVNNFLTSLTNTIAPLPETDSAATTTSVGGSSYDLSTPIAVLDTLLVNLIDDREGSNAPCAITNDVSLLLEDVCVYLTTLSIPPISICKIRNAFVNSNNNFPGNKVFELITSELNRCFEVYVRKVEEETKVFVDYFFTRRLISECEASFMHSGVSYVITADVMERKTGENEFSRIIKVAFCSGGYAYDQIRQRVSLLAYGEILKHVAVLVSSKVINWILRTSFNEWGAILLQKEFMSFYTTFEEICEDSSQNNSGQTIMMNYEKLNWVIKMLVLNSPAEIQRYKIPSYNGYFHDVFVREIMSRRVDVSKDAINNVKLNIVL